MFARSARATRSSRTWRPAQRRTYASEGGHSTQQSSILAGDLPWYVFVPSQSGSGILSRYDHRAFSRWSNGAIQCIRQIRNRLTPTCRAITSLVVTVPSVYYLSLPQIDRYQHPEKYGHGGHHKHDEHGEEGTSDDEGGSSEHGESGDEKTEDQSEGGEEESKEGEKDDGNSDDSGSDGEDKDTPETSDEEGSENTAHEKEGGQNVEGVQFKGATSGGTREGEQGDTRKHIPDAKGFNKKRIESHYGGKEGEAQKPEQDPSDKDLVSVAPCVASLRKTVVLILDRLLRPNLREI